jgi:hypothetical protein
MASTRIVEELKRSFNSDTSKFFGSLARFFLKSSDSFLPLTIKTLTLKFFSLSRRAMPSPSPPLFPVPQMMPTF